MIAAGNRGIEDPERRFVELNGIVAGSLARGAKPCFIVGDFNVDFLKDPKDSIITKISSCGYKQIVTVSTHSAGGLLDNVYIKNIPWEPMVVINFPFYTDHAAVAIVKP